MAEVLNVNPDGSIIHTTIGDFNYDYLVIATGCKTNFFGNTDLEKNTYALKTTSAWKITMSGGHRMTNR